jgi:hypothetical protein
MCTTCSHDVVVGVGGTVVVLDVLVVLVVLVEVVDVVAVLDVEVVDDVDVVAGSVAAEGTKTLVDDELATLVGGVPPVDSICSLHAAAPERTRTTNRPAAARFMPRSRPTVRQRGATPPPHRAPSTRRDGRSRAPSPA